MAYCRKCGSEIDDEDVYCRKCGAPQQIVNSGSNYTNNTNGGTRSTSAIAALGIFLPVIGWIVLIGWIVNGMGKTGSKAKDLLYGNIVGTVVLFIYLFFVIFKFLSL